jgi:MFS family permease
VSLLGTWMQSMAQQVLVYRLTGSASALGIVSFIQVIPLVPFALWGGTLADRFPKRTLILVTQTVMMIQAFLLALFTWSGIVQIWHIYLMAFLLGVAKAVDMPARQSFVVEMVEGKDDLISAIGLNSAIHNGARALGPALAGIAVATLGETVAFFANGLSFLAVIAGLLLMRDLASPQRKKEEKIPVLTEVKEGVRYVLGQQTILVLMSLVAVSSFLARPYSTLMPVLADVLLGDSSRSAVTFLCGGESPLMKCQTPDALPLGLLLSAAGLGAVIGAFLVASLPEDAHRGWLLTLGNLALPALLLAFVMSRSFILSMFLLGLVGLGQVFQNSLANTLLQITTPDHLRGRVMSQYSLISGGMHHLGGLQAGFMADWISAPLSVGLGAAVSLAYGIFVAVRYPRVRTLS